MAHLHYAAYLRMRIARRTYTKTHGYTEYYRTYNGCAPPTADYVICQIQLRTSRHGKFEFCNHSQLGR
eukprot:2442580-Pyramimonas_sp.AAC.1